MHKQEQRTRAGRRESGGGEGGAGGGGGGGGALYLSCHAVHLKQQFPVNVSLYSLYTEVTSY